MDLSEILSATRSLLPSLRVVPSRFRGYQLGNAGASFSYFDGTYFTLIEARLTDVSRENVRQEMQICSKTRIDTLHITSWDRDHCALSELQEILTTWRPKKIEYPGYQPSTDCGEACLKEIERYSSAKHGDVTAVSITPAYITGLGSAEKYGYKNVLFHPKTLVDKSNDNSTVQLFRTGCFNVLSLGDVESPDIAALIKRSKIACGELDVLLLPHHGANNGFLTSDLLDELKPKLAICGANHGNQHGHPAPEVRALLARKGIEVATTVRGDVIVWSDNGTSSVRWVDTMANTTDVHKSEQFEPKKFAMLSQHPDAIRARIKGVPYRGK